MMTKPWILAASLTAVAFAVMALPAAAQNVPVLTNQQEQRVQEIVRAYILEHPEILSGARRVQQARLAEEAAARQAEALKERSEELLYDPATPIGGNPDGPVSVVEFFDYNCPYCRRASPTVAEMLKRNPDVRLVYKELPILGESSEFAARAALAVHRQSPELYGSFHEALMSAKDELTEYRVVDLARQAGVDVERMRSDMDDPAIQAHLDRNIELAKALEVKGTPDFVIGNERVRGAKPLAALQSAVEKARAIP